MAAAIPLVVTFAQAGSVAGMMSMATASVAGFLQVGGAVLGAVGAVTGKKDLQKFGSLMSLGAGIANLANGANMAGMAGERAAVGSMEGLANGVQAGADAAASTMAGEMASSAAEVASAAGDFGPSVWNSIGAPADLAGTGAADMATGMAGAADDFGPGLWKADSIGAAGARTLGAGPANAGAAAGGDFGPGVWGAGNTASKTAESVLAREGSKLTLNDVLKTVGEGIKKTPEWIRQNPDLAKFGFSILEGVYGPEAMAAEEQKRQMDRRLRNINTPIRLTMGGMQGG